MEEIGTTLSEEQIRNIAKVDELPLLLTETVFLAKEKKAKAEGGLDKRAVSNKEESDSDGGDEQEISQQEQSVEFGPEDPKEKKVKRQ